MTAKRKVGCCSDSRRVVSGSNWMRTDSQRSYRGWFS
jgi:hypothetical protein